MKIQALVAASILALSTFVIDDAAAQGRVRVTRQNGEGGVTHVTGANRVGPNGGQSVGARGVVTDGEGNGAAASGRCARGVQGEACRAGNTTRTADGAVTHESGGAFQGANGASGSTQGGFTRNADGTYSGGRTTSATGANGAYDAETTYDSENGVNRTVTCTDPTGAVVACPTR